ncbi:hypothetical protein SAMN03080601_00351 [Alkalitalea saponilacus]|uniref:Uncharacterized protein n=1 Tax=Alkalitalea saponilacus TaxID=889453 RepID=A0A1T5AR98_9BACT|nr:hypothetical protein SAMN03080601_00351 [Alkalitalea saponilacus]
MVSDNTEELFPQPSVKSTDKLRANLVRLVVPSGGVGVSEGDTSDLT